MQVCVPCKMYFRPAENGVFFEEGRPAAQEEESDANGRAPYKLFSADRLECPGCKAQILNSAPHPIGEHFQPGYTEMTERFPPVLRTRN